VSRGPTNGWRSGSDPIQRWLRVVTAITCLGVFVYLAVNGGGADRVATATLALGSVLVLLGYEGIVRLPVIGRNDDDRREKEDP
jgi:hypothetical protein